jgi:hypothetical protein
MRTKNPTSIELLELPWEPLSPHERQWGYSGLEGQARIAYPGDGKTYLLFDAPDPEFWRIDVYEDGELLNYCFLPKWREDPWAIDRPIEDEIEQASQGPRDRPIISEKTAHGMEPKWTSVRLPFAHRILAQSHGEKPKVLCYLPDNESTPWASWRADPERNCFWGHYYSDRTAAYEDYESR